jgi:hypothetical protein
MMSNGFIASLQDWMPSYLEKDASQEEIEKWIDKKMNILRSNSKYRNIERSQPGVPAEDAFVSYEVLVEVWDDYDHESLYEECREYLRKMPVEDDKYAAKLNAKMVELEKYRSFEWRAKTEWSIGPEKYWWTGALGKVKVINSDREFEMDNADEMIYPEQIICMAETEKSAMKGEYNVVSVRSNIVEVDGDLDVSVGDYVFVVRHWG